MRTTCNDHFIILDFIARKYFVKSKNHEIPQYAIFFIFYLFFVGSKTKFPAVQFVFEMKANKEYANMCLHLTGPLSVDCVNWTAPEC
jgi:hypothetical protein